MTIEIPLSKRGKHRGLFVAIIDDEDAVLAEQNWTVSIRKLTNYARRVIQHSPYVDILLHRAVAELMFGEIPEGYEVDHIDGNGLNCIRKNLRLATVSQNRANSRMHFDNLTGFKGVSFRPEKGKYTASINHNKKTYRLGYFDSPEEAKAAWDKKAQELFGKFWNDGTGR